MAGGELTITLNQGDYTALQNALSQMSKIEQDAIVNRGLQEGTRLFVKQGKINLKSTLSTEPQNVKMRNGNLEKSFSTKVKKKQGKGYAGFNKFGHHAHLVDSGTEKRWTKKGAYRGSISKSAPKTGSQFWHNAFKQRKDQAAKELMDSVRKSINKIIERNR